MSLPIYTNAFRLRCLQRHTGQLTELVLIPQTDLGEDAAQEHPALVMSPALAESLALALLRAVQEHSPQPIEAQGASGSAPSTVIVLRPQRAASHPKRHGPVSKLEPHGAAIFAARAHGRSLRQLAQDYGISHNAMYSWMRTHRAEYEPEAL